MSSSTITNRVESIINKIKELNKNEIVAIIGAIIFARYTFKFIYTKIKDDRAQESQHQQQQ